MYNDEPIPEQDDRPQADYVVELWYEMQEQQIASHEAWWQMLDKDESWINSNVD